ncbi:MAG: mechanosensitive ion channel family protein [Anaerolineae bacterium]|nr:mechanosensitive ion channel family protein [Anaerolineae bacterium]
MFNDALIQLIDQFGDVINQIIAYTPRLVAGLLVGAIMLICVRLINRWAQQIALRTEGPPEVEQLIVNSIYFLGITVGLIITLSVLGINVMGLIAGLGLSGLVIGFALKDIIENLLAGVLILIQRPFALGEVIEIDDITGTVTHIQIRSTTLRTADNIEVVIPNSTVYTAIIKNYSAYAVRRRQISLGFGYDENLDEAIRILIDRLQKIDGVVDMPAPSITLNDFGDNAVAGMLYYYIDTRRFDYIGTHTAVVQALQEVVKEHEIDLPYPTKIVINR